MLIVRRIPGPWTAIFLITIVIACGSDVHTVPQISLWVYLDRWQPAAIRVGLRQWIPQYARGGLG